MTETWFTADLHFWHRRMATHWRGFASVEEMNDELIARWNATVGRGDDVYVLGDFSFGSRELNAALFRGLNGRRKYLVRGNHDHGSVTRLGWSDQWDFKRFKLAGQTLYLMHYPMLTWPNASRGTWHLHGHSHGNLQAPVSTRLDVGIDATGQIALSFDEVHELMTGRAYDFVDHHVEDVVDRDGGG